MQAVVDHATHRTVPRFVRERLWWLIPLSVWAAMVAFSFYQQTVQIREHTTEVAVEGARNMFRMVLLTRSWNASHGGIYVPVTPHTPPNPYLDAPRRDVTTTDGVEMTLINPAYMTRLIGEMAIEDAGALFRLTSLKPLRPENKPDEWERRALKAFEKGGHEAFGVEVTDQGNRFRFMAPLPVEKGCLPCHQRQGYKIGDVRGGLSVTQNHAPIEAAIQSGVRKAAVTHGMAFLLVATAGWLLLELLRRRWFELGDKIHALEQAQGQLLQAEKMASIGQLAAGVAHEINNPIGFVNSNLGTLARYSEQMMDLLERSRKGETSEADFVAADLEFLKQDLGDLLSESRDGLARVTKIVSDLKDFSHVDEVAVWAEADLNAGIDKALGVMAHEIKDKADVVRDFGALPRVRCIAVEVDQVVMNLLRNAAQAMATRGVITVRTRHEGGSACIAVTDNGPGIGPDVQRRIFEPFFTTKPVGQGTGLGLSVAYDIVNKHGGRIEVDSRPGQGATFTVWLPVDGPDGAIGQ